MPAVEVRLKAETTAFTAAVQELTQLYRASPKAFLEAFEPAFGLDDLGPKLFRLEALPATEGTILVLLKPTDALLDFLAAFRAGNAQAQTAE